MPIFPLDSIRNASIDRTLEPMLESLRQEIAAFDWQQSAENFDTDGVLEAFDAGRARLNVVTSMLADIHDGPGADISTGLGFLPPLLRKRGLEVDATEHDSALPRFAGAVLPYSIGSTSPPFAPSSLRFLVFGEVLEHLNRSPVRVLTELASLLAAGGRLILTTPNIARLSHIEQLVSGENFLERFDETVPADRPATDFVEHVREYSVREVVDAIEGAGLGVDAVAMTGWGDRGYAPPANPYTNDIIVIRATK